jgi:hypothetical protein
MQRQKLPWDECKYPNNMISNSPAAEIVPSIERGPQRLNEIDEEGGGNLSRRWCVKNTILFLFFFPFGIVLKSKSYCTASKRVAYFQGREATTLWMGAAVRSSVLRKNWDSWTTWRRKLKNPCRQTSHFQEVLARSLFVNVLSQKLILFFPFFLFNYPFFACFSFVKRNNNGFHLHW